MAFAFISRAIIEMMRDQDFSGISGAITLIIVDIYLSRRRH